jgi:quinol-cytochrome oxidoreductase complex cytochrome b subunit
VANTGTAGQDEAVLASPLSLRTAHIISEVFQPPLVVAAILLLSPSSEPGFPGTLWYGLLALTFVCGLPFATVLALVRLGKLTDHHVSNRKQRVPVLIMTAGSVVVGLLVLIVIGAPQSVVAMVLAIVGGIVVLAVVSLFC